jgi:membrane fusion protein, multidrug efflux system
MTTEHNTASRDDTASHHHSARGERSNVRVLTLALVLAVGILAIVYALDWWLIRRFIQTTDDAYVGGNVTAIAPHVSGFVSDILVEDNQFVRAGQVIVRIDATDFETAESRAAAAVQARIAARAELDARVAAQRATIAEAEANLVARGATATFAVADKARYLALASGLGGTRQDAQKALAAADSAQAEVGAAEAALAAARQQMAVIETEIAAADAEIRQAKADLKMAEITRGYATITAPIDGYVGNRAAQRGAFVTTGTTLLSIVPARGLWVDANFEEDKVAGMRPGNPVAFTADALPGQTFHGLVESLSPATGAVFSIIPPENATGNFTKLVQRVPVRIRVAEDAGQLGALRPGLSVTTSVDTRTVVSGQP